MGPCYRRTSTVALTFSQAVAALSIGTCSTKLHLHINASEVRFEENQAEDRNTHGPRTRFSGS